VLKLKGGYHEQSETGRSQKSRETVQGLRRRTQRQTPQLGPKKRVAEQTPHLHAADVRPADLRQKQGHLTLLCPAPTIVYNKTSVGALFFRIQK